MTREELKNKLFDIILKNSSPTIEIKRTIDYQQTMVIVEELINHETDLLKEFVEYLKNKYTKSEKEQIEIYNVYLKEDNRLKSNFHDGCRFGFELARTSMDQDLEKFFRGEVKYE